MSSSDEAEEIAEQIIQAAKQKHQLLSYISRLEEELKQSQAKSRKKKKEKTEAKYIPVDKVKKESRDCQTGYDSVHMRDKVKTEPSVSQTMYEPAMIGEIMSTMARSMAEQSLPTLTVPVFDGDPGKYHAFLKTFDAIIGNKTIPPETKLFYLCQYTTGEVEQMMQTCLPMSPATGYERARQLLEETYGRNSIIIEHTIQRLVSGPPVKSEDLKGLRQLYMDLVSCNNLLTDLKHVNKLDNISILHKVVERFPFDMKRAWRAKAVKLDELGHDIVLEDIVRFVSKTLTIMSHPVFGTITSDKTSSTKNSAPNPTKSITKPSTSNSKTVYSFSTVTEGTEGQSQSQSKLCKCCNEPHPLFKCDTFKKKTLADRQKFASNNRLCFNCLVPMHSAKECRNERRCQVCSGRHHTLLHQYEVHQSSEQSVPQAQAISRKTSCSVSCTMIVPVYVSSKHGKKIKTYCLLDDQSDTSFISPSLVKRLDLTGDVCSLKLGTMHGTAIVQTFKHKGLVVSNINERDLVTLEVPCLYERDIPYSEDQIPTPKIAQNWPHLSNLPLHPLQSGLPVGIMLGTDMPQALRPRDIVAGGEHEPYGQRSLLGWGIVGNLVGTPVTDGTVRISHRLSAKEIMLDNYDHSQTVSQDDISFLKQMATTAKCDDNGRYVLPLPVKESAPFQPGQNGFQEAEQRLKALKRKLRNDAFREEYSQCMDNLFSNGQAEVISDDQIHKDSQYIPHHGVRHPRSNKLRVVFDCRKLNEHLLQGPDLNSALISVLNRCRLKQVLVVCDIQQMYLQFEVSQEHRDLLRFLWFNEHGDIIHCRMKVHLFGATSSPSVAVYGFRSLADDNREEFPNAARAVENNFYVDDGLLSADTDSEAASLVTELRALCEKGKLKLHKFATNSDTLKPFFESVITPERVLGVKYDVHDDTFSIDVSLQDRPNSNTKRGVLSAIASVYDPLGFSAPLMLEAKLILQESFRQGCDWDEALEEKLMFHWLKWKTQVQSQSVKVPRCLQPISFGTLSRIDFHTFADASSKAYAACTYARLEDSSGHVHCALIMGKSRVVPLNRQFTIPRLELMAACMAAKLGNSVVADFSPTVSSASYYWTDSNVVLGYLRNQSKRFHIFVANRIQQILDLTSVGQWNHVVSDMNPADVATRCEKDMNMWLNGPKFLMNDNPLHDSEESEDIEVEDLPEVKAMTTTCHPGFPSLTDRLQRFSDYFSAQKSVALCMKYGDILKGKSQKGHTSLTTSDMQKAELAILRAVQAEAYEDELSMLTQPHDKKKLKASSKLYCLDPFIDEDGLIRVGGRIKKADVSIKVRHPVILPKHHHISKLLVRQAHEQSWHGGRGATLSTLRSNGYWIGGGRSAMNFTCTMCRRQRGVLQVQKMSDLPKDRLETSAPFTYVSCDLFGPFLCKEKRSEVKRYGVIFVCQASRAVHVETVNEATSDSFINCLRRFIAVRGPIKQLRCDRGTNFVGAKNELEKAYGEIESAQVREYLLHNKCDFVFNFPSASHMGGSWERMIRTIKNLLFTQLVHCGTHLNDESLRTFLAEAAAIMNSRPLTVNDISSLEPLSPNHILTAKSSVVLPPPGKFQREDLYLKKHWRRVQHILNEFWNRWKKEVLAELQTRSKWTQVSRNIAVGDIVILKTEDTPRNKWPLARVTKVFPSEDGLVRKVSLFMGPGNPNVERPIHKLVLLLESSE